MPKVYLQGRCSKPTDQPDVCARCGAETTNRVKKTFSWYPPWIIVTFFIGGLPLYLILAIVLRKTYTVAVPLCAEHKGHWTKRLLLNLLGVFGLLGGGIALGVLFFALGDSDPANRETYAGVGVLTIIGGILACLVLVVITSTTAIRTTEITDRGIRLAGVGKEFVAAYEEQEDEEREARRGAMDRWDDRKSRRREDDEDDRPRRRDEKRIRADDEEDERPRRRDDKRVRGEEDY